MLTYTFTRREKGLLLLLAIVLLVIVWFVFVYQGTTNRMTEIDSEISTVQSEISVSETRVAQLDQMTSTIEQRKAAGVQPTLMPAYDNMRSLMGELNRIMAAADTYSLTFDQLAQDEQGHIERGVRVDFGTSSEAKAESIVRAFAGGKYPCRIDTVAIVDSSAKNKTRVSSSGSPTNASVHVTFFESVENGAIPPELLQEKKDSQK